MAAAPQVRTSMPPTILKPDERHRQSTPASGQGTSTPQPPSSTPLHSRLRGLGLAEQQQLLRPSASTVSQGNSPAPKDGRAPAGASNESMLDRLRGAQQTVVDTAQGAARLGGHVVNSVQGKGSADMRREGTLTDPNGGAPVPLERAMAEAKTQGKTFGEWLMGRYAFKPSNPTEADRTLRIFSPGLNTPEPVASKRTAYYADKLNQPMLHLHNGTNMDASVPSSENIDYATSMATRNTDRRTPLIDGMVTLLKSALSGAEPQDVHAILYSDSTIAGSKAIAIVRQQMIKARVGKGEGKAAAEKAVDALLRKHLFVELHGNVVADLPKGPRYVAWADREDDLTHKKLPGGGELGLSGTNRDKDADVLYMDYDGPFGGADAHNLQATGVHAVRQTWWANGVRDSEGLFEKAKSGANVKPAANIKGDKGKLWNPRNDPAWRPPAGGK